jgi:hypothetical protein
MHQMLRYTNANGKTVMTSKEFQIYITQFYESSEQTQSQFFNIPRATATQTENTLYGNDLPIYLWDCM